MRLSTRFLAKQGWLTPLLTSGLHTLPDALEDQHSPVSDHAEENETLCSWLRLITVRAINIQSASCVLTQVKGSHSPWSTQSPSRPPKYSIKTHFSLARLIREVAMQFMRGYKTLRE